MYSGDFSTMYTTIPHKDLREKIRDCLKEACAFWATSKRFPEHQIRFHITKHKNVYTASWCRARSRDGSNRYSDTQWTLSVEGLMELFSFLIDNTYVLNGAVLRQQLIGIPMGTNCSPVVSNLYLYAYESQFIDRLVNANKEDIAKGFHSFFQYIDDVLSLDNPDFTQYVTSNPSTGDNIGCMYPKELQLQSTILPNNTAHFLGMEVSPTKNNDGWQLNIFDKRTSFPFDVIRYPHMDSTIPINIPYGVFTGLLYRRYRICTHSDDFVHQSYLAAIQLQEKGCSKFRLQKLFRMFLSKQSSLRWKETIHRLCQKFATRLLRMRQFSTDRFD
jgi:hypothetical protein